MIHSNASRNRQIPAVLLALICGVGVGGRAEPCNGLPPPSIDKAYNAASSVFLGIAETVQHVTVSLHGLTLPQEIARFRVLVVWKGPFKPGDTAIVKSITNYPDCPGVSMHNDPVWLVDGRTGKPAPMSGIWLIYGEGEQPYSLPKFGSRSMPLEYGGADDFRALYSLSTDNAAARPRG